jgi:hypothetical protein
VSTEILCLKGHIPQQPFATIAWMGQKLSLLEILADIPKTRLPYGESKQDDSLPIKPSRNSPTSLAMSGAAEPGRRANLFWLVS